MESQMAFKKGQSGNPNGKPKGLSNAYTSRIRESQQKNEPELLELFYRKAREIAEQNDDISGLHAVYKSTERHRGQIVPINLRGSLTEQMKAIQEATAEGILTPSEVVMLMTSVEKQAKVIETVELERKVNLLWDEKERNVLADTERETREMYGIES